MPPKPTVAPKKQPLNLAQLSSYDDLLTDALVDHTYYWTTIPKNRPSYHPSRGVKEEEITKIIQTEIIVNEDLAAAERKLLATEGIRKFVAALKTDKQKQDFRDHLRRYMQIYLPDCPVEVNSTNRYTIVSHEASITARRFIKRNETIKYLSGIQVTITPEEEREIAARKKDFSIIVSSRNKCTSLFMGPARFANHDCRANAKLMITSNAGIAVVATTNIDVGEEITVTYGENYFGEDNCECLCQSCEDSLINGWAPAEGQVVVKKSIEDISLQGYSLRRRRREDVNSREGSLTPSVTPGMRPKIMRGAKVRLSQQGLSIEPVASPTPDGGMRLLPKKRPAGTLLATPPITPAKRLKTAENDDRPIPLELERSSSNSSTASEVFSASPESGDAVLTDATSPEKETPGPVIHSPKPTPIRRPIQLLKQEESEGGLERTTPFEWTRPSGEEEAVRSAEFGELTLPARATEDDNSKVVMPSIVTTTTTVTALHVTTQQPSPMSSPSSATPRVTIETADVAQAMEVSEVVATVAGSEETVAQEEEEASASQPPKKRKYQRRLKQASPPPPPILSRQRVPGDYTLTPLLLCEPDAAWIYCTVCSGAFVQANAYYTRSACPRCERHSKLYGYVWPKTEKAGPGDKEERVLDHRTVHRFLDAEDEAKARNRKYTAYIPRRGTQSAAEEEDEDEESTPMPRRGRGRPAGRKSSGLSRVVAKRQYRRKGSEELDSSYENEGTGSEMGDAEAVAEGEGTVRRSARRRRASVRVLE